MVCGSKILALRAFKGDLSAIVVHPRPEILFVEV